jgi:molecular chaperone DnaK
MEEVIVGIDLGTTNSEVAAFVEGRPRIIARNGVEMLPSCVGLSASGQLLIGQPARNQMRLFPERTIRSVKRLMGTDQKLTLGDRTFSPPEISALIVRELASWAQESLGRPVTKAVITVPAYFSDAQRNATREAGALAGLEVVRIVNEPTAASLAYGLDASGSSRTVMIYDLGGGTLDVSIVRIEGEVTEVLASHGDNQLGGDDFDQKLLDHLLDLFRQQHKVDLRDQHPGATSRLWFAAEEAQKRLSFEPYARVREESLIQVDGRPLHLDVEISRRDYEGMIRPLVERTLVSAHKALEDAGLVARALDAVLLVGGSTRTPLVVEQLEKLCGQRPRQDLHPDLCVALGAGVLASRLAGHAVDKVLVDVSPFGFGPSYLGEYNGRPYAHCYHPVIPRNVPLPVTRTDEYFTASDFQTKVELDIYQGEDPDALRNVHIGRFTIEGLTAKEGPNPVLCRMRLDVDGILHVTAIEKETGLTRHVAISGATRRRTSTEITRDRDRIEALYANRVDDAGIDPAPAAAPDADLAAPTVGAPEEAATPAEPATTPEPEAEAAPTTAADGAALAARCRQLMETLHADDKEEALGLIEDVETAATDADRAAAIKALREFLFFVEGR